MATCDIISDLIIIGGGPTGISAAINGASEGLNIRLIDNGPILGGQAKESSAIENYPGFPESITGIELMDRMVQQARKFAASVTAPVSVATIEQDGNAIHLTCDDYTEYRTRAVLIATGVSYRRLMADNIGNYIGKGVYYGVPSFKPTRGVRNVAVVGGANSAGQAALGLAANPRINVKLLARSSLVKSMSTYLINRIMTTPNIEVIEMCEVTFCSGRACLTDINVRHNGVDRLIPIEQMNIFIGAQPRTLWLRNSEVELDEYHFVKTGSSSLYFETSMPGVFAAGDVRSGSIKRIASGIGEGAGALQMIHSYLNR